jgi:prepilin-type N-terminal cleavage/methylation domain-containing protein
MVKTTERQSGFTMIEVIVVVAILGMALAGASLYFKPMEGRLQTGVALAEGQLRQARVRAMATTSAFRVRADSSTRIVAESAASCAATTWAAVPELNVDLPGDVTLTDTSWSFCFGARGVSTVNATIALRHPRLGTTRIEVLRGGTTRIVQ